MGSSGRLGVSGLVALCAIGLIGCPPPQSRWAPDPDKNAQIDEIESERIRAGQEQIAALRELREGAGLGRDYRVGPGDLLQVTVFDVANFDRASRVSETGRIKLPLVGQVKVEGLTERELEEAIAERLGAQFIKDPQVSVFVQEYRSQRVAVLGAVLKPGQYNLTKDKSTILDMMSEAGGLARDAGSRLYLMPGERIEPTKLAMLTASAKMGVSDTAALEEEIAGDGPIMVDVRNILNPGTQAVLTLPARAGDVILVPEGGQFLVDGWVDKPGSYSLTRGTTVLGALTQAGGPLYPAKTESTQIVRTKMTGVRMKIDANIEDIIDGKAQDVTLESGDIIIVPASSLKLPLYGIYKFFTDVFRIAGTIPLF